MFRIDKIKLENLKIEISQCKTKGEFKKKNKSGYIYLARRNLLREFIGHLPTEIRIYESKYGAQNSNFKYTDEELEKEALKYKNKAEFRKKNKKMSIAAYKRGKLFWKKITAHMPETLSIGRPCPWKKWDKNTIPSEALKYATKNEFQYGSSGAFSVARKLGILDEVCKHMVSGYTISSPEKELYNILKELFPKSHKKKYRTYVPVKPWIKRFELDILNPINMRAIEYDGEYHHSEKHLVKNKTERGWPIEDAKNYHHIKDSYFINYHNIKVLHIKGEDWKRDKQVCIQLAIAWLGGNCSIYPKSLKSLNI